MRKVSSTLLLMPIALGFAALAGCGGSSSDAVPAPLSDQNTNLIFVLSPDLTYAATGDVNPVTSNLTSQGLRRSLLMADYLKRVWLFLVDRFLSLGHTLSCRRGGFGANSIET